MASESCAKPCAKCPFSKAVTPGALGGSEPTTYIGQSVGAFWLPCHMSPGYEEDRANHAKHRQCVGAAMYRDLNGLSSELPPLLLSLKGDPTLVFSSHAEFLAHHKGMTLEEANTFLEVTPPNALHRVELIRLRRKLRDGDKEAFVRVTTR
jgi:hypothetical protein